jgi:adenosylcobinamide-GDP ribazoletransferase
VLAVLTGGLHLDGLADCADGLLIGASRERRLEVMRDPRLGTFGVVALILLLLAEAAVLAHLGSPAALSALVAAGAFSRLAMLAVLVLLPYVRHEGLGQAAKGPGRRDLVLGALLAAPVLLLDWPHALVAAAGAAVAAAAVATLARSRIGGATGDVYGATCEMAQLLALLAFAVRA